MHARATIVRFHPGAINEATHIFREVMLPRASAQPGFRGAYILMSDTHPDNGIIITLWDTLDDLLSSTPPDDIAPQLDRLDELIAEVNQDTYHVMLSLL
jgi:hypothetical protein